MDTTELNEKLEKLGNSWEHFKHVNNERLLQLEKKNIVDPLTEIKLERLNTAIEEQKSKINSLEIAMSRPSYSDGEYKSSENLQHRQAFTNYLRKGIEEQLANIEIKRDLIRVLTTQRPTAAIY
ncbi:MAG: phage major capsid protein [Rickettsiales bacterium]|jgi:HK97 family phage major capsid protein|nr:phage major capsid protein [Rickettsiales bacterium]